MCNEYFVYSSDNGFETFATAAEAEAVAEDLISKYREDAYEDGWDDDVESVCWGRVSQKARAIRVSQTPDPVHGNYLCDYVLKGY
jgi:hypothetical protein